MIYCLGARYGGEWMVNKFVDAGVACVGWKEEDAPAIYKQLRSIQIGDIIALKAFGASSETVTIMAVGVVTDDDVRRVTADLGYGIEVDWVKHDSDEEGWTMNPKASHDKHRNCRVGTLYQEFNPIIQRDIIDLMLHPDNWDED